MEMQQIYSEAQLLKIIDAALVHICACPAQVSRQILDLRKLYQYQRECISRTPSQEEVHRLIGQSTAASHAEMERCLGRILEIQGWDVNILAMPPGMSQLRDAHLGDDVDS